MSSLMTSDCTACMFDEVCKYKSFYELEKGKIEDIQPTFTVTNVVLTCRYFKSIGLTRNIKSIEYANLRI